MSDLSGSDTEHEQDGDVDSDRLYDGDVGESWGNHYGWFHSSDSDRVYNPQNGPEGPVLITGDGEIEPRYVQRALDKVARGKGGLWGRLAPVEIGDIEIRRDTEIWHDDRDAWLKADFITLIKEPEVQPKIRFRVKGTTPVEHVTYRAEILSELREEGVIESKQEVNERAEDALESIRERRGESA